MGSEKIIRMPPQEKTMDILVVITLYLIFVLPGTILTTLPPLLLTAAWFLLPSAYLITRRKKNIAKISFATLIIGLLAFSLDIFLLHNHAWEPYASSFSFRIFGVPPEEISWFFLHIFFILVFYEHFIDDGDLGRFRITRRIKPLIWFSAGVFIFTLLAIYGFPHASRIPYAYAVMSAVAMFPILIYCCGRRFTFLKKLLPFALFFFCFASIMEIRAVQEGLWAFRDTSNYLGIMTLFGAAFPIEEIMFWMALGPSVAIAYYELFADDGA